MKNTWIVVVVAGAMLGCSTGGEPGSTSGGLTLSDTRTGIEGSYESTAELGRVEFTSQFVDTNVLEIVLEFHGMSVTALIDFDSGVIEYDGFTSTTGEPTQILEEDRALIIELTRALDALGTNLDEPTVRLRGFVSTWSEFPTTLDPQFIALMDEDRDYTSICGRVNTYQRASHDCWETQGDCPDGSWYLAYADKGCRWGDDNSTVDYTYVSMHSAGSCSDGTFFWNGSWTCYEPNHVNNIEYSYGNCFGRCGGGCGSDTQFTWDCLDHDECVRFGHGIADLGCDDEFMSTTDDWTFAPSC